MPLDMVLAQLYLGLLPGQFSVPEPARGYLIKFDSTLVSVEDAAPGSSEICFTRLCAIVINRMRQ